MSSLDPKAVPDAGRLAADAAERPQAAPEAGEGPPAAERSSLGVPEPPGLFEEMAEAVAVGEEAAAQGAGAKNRPEARHRSRARALLSRDNPGVEGSRRLEGRLSDESLRCSTCHAVPENSMTSRYSTMAAIRLPKLHIKHGQRSTDQQASRSSTTPCQPLGPSRIQPISRMHPQRGGIGAEGMTFSLVSEGLRS